MRTFHVSAREKQVGQHTPGSPGEACILDCALVNNQKPLTLGRTDDGVRHPYRALDNLLLEACLADMWCIVHCLQFPVSG